MPTDSADLILVNANVITMDIAQPNAEAVAICADRIAAVGSDAFIQPMASGRTRIVDCKGLTLIPGFNDAHCHLPGLARRMQDLDCSPHQALSIRELMALIRTRAEARSPGTWVRGFGYDDFLLAEGRHPSRHDLDVAAPDNPVWLEHRSGHASVLNSRALQLAGIHRETPDPPGGVIERDPGTDEPTGVLLETRSLLRQRLGTLRTRDELDSGVRAADEMIRQYGITSIQDAGPDNGIERWKTFSRLQADGVSTCRITMFAGVGRLDELTATGLCYGSGGNRLRLGHAKIVLTLTSGGLHPPPTELEAMIAEAHGRGFPVAVHCIEEGAIALVAAALIDNRQGGLHDRIEHCAEGTPPLVDLVRRSGATVVTQPGFLFHNGAVYRESVEPRLLPHLYPSGALLRSGVATAFSSDAPVIDPNPWPAIYSAVTRCASDGFSLVPGENSSQDMSMVQALRAYTMGSAEAEGTSADKGSITPGKLADLVLVDTDPLAVDHDRLPEVKALMTLVSGTVVWDDR